MDFSNNVKKSDGAGSQLQTGSVQKNAKPWEIGYKILNRYEILDIKKGGMGTVYIAHDHEWNQRFAVKTFQEKFLWNEGVIQRFIAEAETWVYLGRHSNIVHAYSMQLIEGKPFLFLDYIEGGDLNRWIGRMERGTG